MEFQKFGSNTPDKSIITYVFNNTIMDFRPIIIDTPGTGQHRQVFCHFYAFSSKLHFVHSEQRNKLVLRDVYKL